MPPFADWFPHATTGLVMTSLGLAKFYGRWAGIVGGRGRPALDRLCGTCPRPLNRTIVNALPYLFLAIGVFQLYLCARAFGLIGPAEGS